jgi:hypothetical protein
LPSWINNFCTNFFMTYQFDQNRASNYQRYRFFPFLSVRSVILDCQRVTSVILDCQRVTWSPRTFLMSFFPLLPSSPSGSFPLSPLFLFSHPHCKHAEANLVIGRERNRLAVPTKHSSWVTSVGNDDLVRRYDGNDRSGSNRNTLGQLELAPALGFQNVLVPYNHFLVHAPDASLHRNTKMKSLETSLHSNTNHRELFNIKALEKNLVHMIHQVQSKISLQVQ